ncbi:MAG: hypothetical protein AB7P00_29815, partial [Sandaracinaceae bacterium]
MARRRSWVRPVSPVGAIALGVSALVGCTSPPHRASASSIVLDPSGDAVYVASPDDDAVVAIDARTLEERWRVSVVGAPTQLAIVGGELLVSLDLANKVAWVDLGDRSVRRSTVPCGGTRAVVADGSGGALVSCPYDDRVLSLDAAGVRWVIASPGRPTALAVRGDAFAVSAPRTGLVRVCSLSDGALREERTLEAAPGFAAVEVDALDWDDDGELVVSFVRVDRDSDRGRPPADGGYGRVREGEGRIEPRLAASFGTTYARFDRTARALSGPSALAVRGDVVWIAARSSDRVAAFARRSSGGLLDHRVTFAVGRGPRGIAVSDDGRTAYVDVGYGHTVARLELDAGLDGPEGELREATLERTRAFAADRLSEDALRGRGLFDDANDTHLTPSGVLTCATCHPDGGDDGLSWFLHTETVGPKLRRTPPAWGARPGMEPFHWDGEFDDAGALSDATIRALMEGDALLVDTDAIAAWMREAPIPVGRAAEDAGDAARIERGADVFARAGCDACHAGELFADGAVHDVVP